jgi:hypothetical protein
MKDWCASQPSGNFTGTLRYRRGCPAPAPVSSVTGWSLAPKHHIALRPYPASAPASSVTGWSLAPKSCSASGS